MKNFSTRLCLACLLTLTAGFFTQRVAEAQRIPNPVLYMTRSDRVKVGGKELVRYSFDVENKDAFPAELFATAPSLPPCGSNTNASRTWVDIYDQRGKRLNGFCALKSPKELDSIWFAMEPDEVPPSYVYIEINDRQTNTKYKSNLADTTI
jgi:hypothetical protein